MSTSVGSLTNNFFPNAQNGFTTTTAGSVLSGATSVALNSVAGYTNAQPAVFVIDPTDVTKKQTFTGIIDTSGVQVTSVVWTAGTNQIHALGATVVDYATATHISMISKGIGIGHTLDGTHKPSLPLTTPKITTSIGDANGNEVIRTPATASAVNDVTVTNAATGGSPSIAASGDDSAIALNLRGKGLAKGVNIGAGAVNIFPYDYVASGCVWTADAAGSTRVASMTAGVVVINGNPITVAAVTSRTFTASKDVYVDVLDNGDGTGLLVYTDGTTNAASGALASNSIRLAIVVVGASNIATAASVNQGQYDRVLPIASSIAYTFTDSLGNIICPRDPNRRVIGYKQIVANQTGITTTADITGLSAPVIVPIGRNVKITTGPGTVLNGTTGGVFVLSIVESSTELSEGNAFIGASSTPVSVFAMAFLTPSAGLHTYKVQGQATSGSGQITAGAIRPTFVLIELE